MKILQVRPDRRADGVLITGGAGAGANGARQQAGAQAVKEAAVVAVKHPKWDERPVACVVLREGAKATPDELREYLEPMFAKFQLPDAYVFMQAIPRTAAGKFLKSALREQLKDFKLEK